MVTTKGKTNKTKSSEQKETKPKRISKTWLAMLEHEGNGSILDMEAVLK